MPLKMLLYRYDIRYNHVTINLLTNLLQNSSRQQGPGDIINEVSFLASTAAGERHYLGSTSGVLFADLVRASLDVKAPREPSSIPNHNPIPGPLIQYTHANHRDTHPSRRLAYELFENYFAHDHLCYPFLIPSSTFAIVDLRHCRVDLQRFFFLQEKSIRSIRFRYDFGYFYSKCSQV